MSNQEYLEWAISIALVVSSVAGVSNFVLSAFYRPTPVIEVNTENGVERMPLSNVLNKMMLIITEQNKQVFDACRPANE